MDAWHDTEGQFAQMELISVLGSGGYSTTWRAVTPQHAEVAVKIFRRSAYKDVHEIARLNLEMRVAQELVHPHIVTALGTLVLFSDDHPSATDARGPSTSDHARWSHPPVHHPALVLELMHGGSLSDRLHHSRADSPPLQTPTRARIVHEVALGLAYLHERELVHRDIKTSNVLLSNDLRAKLCDFGVTTRFSQEHTADVGTTRYMAPEVLFGRYNHLADIYSFGLLLWETLNGSVPFASMRPMAAMLRLRQGQRPPCDKMCPASASLARRCWDASPPKRPAMPQIIDELLAILEELQAVKETRWPLSES